MTYVSNHTNDCAARDAIRSELWAQMAEWERKAGPVQTAPIQQREVEARVDLVINAKTQDCGKKADGKHNERNAGRLSLPVVKPDHAYPITNIMLSHAFRKLRVTKASVAKMMNRSQSYISNVCNGKAEAGDDVRRTILACIWKLSEVAVR